MNEIEELVSSGDLTYRNLPGQSEGGLPLGNGRMGSLVWLGGDSINLQVNRVDVFACNSYTGSFGYTRGQESDDYCGGCGSVSVKFAERTFLARARQHLSLYSATVNIEGDGVKARLLAWHRHDVIAIQVTDERRQGVPVRIDVDMLRPPYVKTVKHCAISRVARRQECIILEQEFDEPADNEIRKGDHHCRTALAVGIAGATASPSETSARLTVAPGQGTFTVFISSASSLRPESDVTGQALEQMEAALRHGFNDLMKDNQEWWRNFWERSSVELHSEDGVAGFVQGAYYYYLYIMGSCSRGEFMPKFNGMLWNTQGDDRMWGSQYWWWNQQTLYRALPAANHLELMAPLFDTYSGMHDASALAARQQWDSKGIFIPETVAFNGLEELPEEIAGELRDYLLERKSWDDTALAFRRYCQRRHRFSARWNCIHYELPSGEPHSYVAHLFSSAAKIAWLYWQQFEYTQDRGWLRQRAYPMLKGVAEFYRNYPNFRKGEDGLYHIYRVNSHETVWGARDTTEELSAISGILPVAIRAAEMLDVASDLREKWREVLQHLTPLPTSEDPDALLPREMKGEHEVWAEFRGEAVKVQWGVWPGCSMRPCAHYDLVTLETDDSTARTVAENSFDTYMQVSEHTEENLSILTERPIVAAMLGRADQVKMMLPLLCREPEGPDLPNRMTLAEGHQAQTVEHLGTVAYALQLALCQSVAPGPGEEPVIRVFPAWPKEWDARFKLLCKGGFLVSAALRAGRVEYVEVLSQLGGRCRLRNPWGDVDVTVDRKGVSAEKESAGLLTFETSKGERILLKTAESERGGNEADTGQITVKGSTETRIPPPT